MMYTPDDVVDSSENTVRSAGEFDAESLSERSESVEVGGREFIVKGDKVCTPDGSTVVNHFHDTQLVSIGGVPFVVRGAGASRYLHSVDDGKLGRVGEFLTNGVEVSVAGRDMHVVTGGSYVQLLDVEAGELFCWDYAESIEVDGVEVTFDGAQAKTAVEDCPSNYRRSRTVVVRVDADPEWELERELAEDSHDDDCLPEVTDEVEAAVEEFVQHEWVSPFEANAEEISELREQFLDGEMSRAEFERALDDLVVANDSERFASVDDLEAVVGDALA